MGELGTTTGIVALAAAAAALVALVACAVLALRLRRVRAEQRAVLGDERTDLVTHAAGLELEFRTLHDYVEDMASRLEQRMSAAEHRLDDAIAYRALVRYDAYGEMSGRQSTTIALLDSSSSGVVLSSIHHRDQARIYAKRVRDGRGENDLSPEEAEAVRAAMSGEQPPEAAA